MLADLRSQVVVAPAFRDFVQSALRPTDTLRLVSFSVRHAPPGLSGRRDEINITS